MTITFYNFSLNELKKYSLDKNANEYALSVLNNFRLAKSEHHARKILKTKAYTLLPEGVKIDKVERFSDSIFMYGGIDREEGNLTTDKALTQYVCKQLTTNPNLKFTIHDIGLDSYIEGNPYTCFTYGEKNLEILMQHAIRMSSGWTFLGFLTTDTSSKKSLIENCTHIFVGAFDGEGYLILELDQK